MIEISFGWCVYFQWAADRLSDLTPSGAICLRAGGLVGEWDINAALSSDSGTRRVHSPPSSLGHIVNPAVPLASRGPAWRTAQNHIQTERGKETGDPEKKRRKEMFGSCSNLICSARFDGIYVDVGQSASLPVAVCVSVSKSPQWRFCGFLLLIDFTYFSISDWDWRIFI